MPAWDTELFLWINVGLSNGIFDAVLPLMREKVVWVPLYVFVSALVLFNHSFPRSLYLIIAVLVTMALSDTISSKIIKPTVNRDRPCQVDELKDQMNLRVGCGGGKSFTSSHAFNHFCAATMFFFLFSGFRRLRWIFFIWAALISFAQVYVGVHYPLDIMVGGLLGFLLGFGAWKMLLFRLYIPKKKLV